MFGMRTIGRIRLTSPHPICMIAVARAGVSQLGLGIHKGAKGGKRMRRALALVGTGVVLAAAVGATLSSTASGRPAHKQANTINIAVFLASSANTYWQASL